MNEDQLIEQVILDDETETLGITLDNDEFFMPEWDIESV